MNKMEKLENKTVNLKKLHEVSEKDLLYALNNVAGLMGRKLSDEEVRDVYENGLPVYFRGGAPLRTPRQNYILFYHPHIVGKPRLNVRCEFSILDHRGFINNGNPIFGGTLNGNRFESTSPTWTSEVKYGTPAYDFGKAVNEVMLDHFGIKR